MYWGPKLVAQLALQHMEGQDTLLMAIDSLMMNIWSWLLAGWPLATDHYCWLLTTGCTILIAIPTAHFYSLFTYDDTPDCCDAEWYRTPLDNDERDHAPAIQF